MASRRHQRPRSLEPNGFAFSLEPRPARRPSSGSSSSPAQPSGSTSSSHYLTRCGLSRTTEDTLTKGEEVFALDAAPGEQARSAEPDTRLES